MTLITLSSSVCAEAPGYVAVTTIEGGATEGYCAIGSCLMATPPSTRMNSASTHAKIGRSMKNCAIARALQREAGAAGADGAAAAAEAAPPPGAPEAAAACHGTGLTGALPRSF